MQADIQRVVTHHWSSGFRSTVARIPILSVAAILFPVAGHATAFTPATYGTQSGGYCPVFHCDPGGQGLMKSALPLPPPPPPPVTTLAQPWSQGNTDKPGYESCSSDGTNFTCLYLAGSSVTARSINGPTLTQKFVLYSTDLDPASASPAVPPLIGTDHSMIVADINKVQRRDANGSSTSTGMWTNTTGPSGLGTPASGYSRIVMGITPLQASNIVVVTYSDNRLRTNSLKDDGTGKGYLIAYDASTGAVKATFTGVLPPAVSPPVAHGNSLYYIGLKDLGSSYNYRYQGQLFKIDFNPSTNSFSQAAQFNFGEEVGGSAVYYEPSSGPTIVLHQPQRSTGNGVGGCGTATFPNQDRIVGLDASTLQCKWSNLLSAPLTVSPAIDPTGGFWLYPYAAGTAYGTYLQHFTDAGTPDRTIYLNPMVSDISTPIFSGHLYSTQATGSSDVYVMSIISGGLGAGVGKRAIAIDVTTSSLAWENPIDGLGDLSYGGSLPLVTLTNSKPGVVISGGALLNTTNTGNVVVLGQ